MIALLPRVGLRPSPLGAATLLAREEPWRRGVVAGEDDGQGRQFVAADDEEGPEEGVPRPVEVDHDCGEQERPGDGKGDLEEDLKVVGAVDDGGVDVLVGQREKGLAREENGKGGDGAGQDDSGVGIKQPKTVYLEEEGDHEELLGARFVRGEGWAFGLREWLRGRGRTKTNCDKGRPYQVASGRESRPRRKWARSLLAPPDAF